MTIKKQPKRTLYTFDPKQILTTHRQLFLYGEINAFTAYHIKSNLIAMDIVSHDPIMMYISSHGGCCDSGLSIIEIMRFVKSPVVTIISGSVMSMASIISICGDKRLAFSTSTWGQHPTSALTGDYLKFIKDRTAYLVKADKVLYNIMKENTKLTPADFKKIESGELWLMGEQLIEKGIVDRLIDGVK